VLLFVFFALLPLHAVTLLSAPALRCSSARWRLAMRDYLDAAMHDAGRIELRHECDGRWRSGLFDDADALRLVARRLADAGNLYCSLNAPRLIPTPNAMGATPLTDGSITHHVRLPLDFDPLRPTGTPSTDAELELALAARDRLVAALSALGWPAPARAVSGNGAHALYRCRLPAGDATRDMLRTLYAGLKADFGTQEVAFDSTVRNAGRIWRCYGTTNRKGTPLPGRPHRRAVVAIPNRWEAVSPRQVARLADSYARKPAPAAAAAPRAALPAGAAGDFRTLDVVAWFAAHGLYRRPLGESKHAARCPWDAEHSTVDHEHSTATVIWQAAGGWPSFKCSHSHCEGRGIRDVMARLGDADRFCSSSFARRAAS
jgi:hypothetical protein